MAPQESLRRGLFLTSILLLAVCSTAAAQELSRACDPLSEATPAGDEAWAGFVSDRVTDLTVDAASNGPCDCPDCCRARAEGKPVPPRVTCCHGCEVNWAKIPATVRPVARTGNFNIPPAPGPGYYSLWDFATGECRAKPPKSGYPSFVLMPPSFFDADFRYVETLDPDERTLVEKLKRIPLNDCLMFSTGGQFWLRYMNEHNVRLSEVDSDYTLSRVRMFGDVNYSDHVRVFGEFIWADCFAENLPAAAIDVNRGDLLNLFIDLRLFDWDDHGVYVRGGRQELLFGSQRLISTLDWANVRRTFQGVKVFRQGDKWDFDAFWTQPVPVSPNDFDSPDENTNFAGSWLTYRPEKGRFLDFYYLYWGNSNNVTQQGIVRYPADIHTLGSRWSGDKNGFLWDAELMLQLGQQQQQNLLAGAGTVGLGRNWKDACYSPTAWIYYDYASGDANPNDGEFHTFNQLHPFGHYYLGWIDLVGRQNIHDLNAHFYLYPTPWITAFVQYHHFWLNQSTDALYGVAGNAYRRDPTGAAGTNVGDEIDFVANFHVAQYSELLLGYSRLFGGGFLEKTAGPNQAADAELFHMSFSQRW
jgi:hypothetical protein